MTGGHLSVRADLYFYHDAQNLAAVSVGMTWLNPHLQMDSASVTPMADNAFDFFKFLYVKDHIDSTNIRQLFMFQAARLFGELPLGATPQHVASYWFSIDSWFINDSICIDSLTLSSGISMWFVSADGVRYKPMWQGMSCVEVFDTDGDGIGDPWDNCPNMSNPGQVDRDGDGLGDSCDVCMDDALNDGDSDDICGDIDNCIRSFNPEQEDADGDGIGDSCDNCPQLYNSLQIDQDGDGFGTACDCNDTDAGINPNTVWFLDSDNDGHGITDTTIISCEQPTGYVLDSSDNCPDVFNPTQADSNGDGFGDACCCVGSMGNVDCEGIIDIGDVTTMILNLFITLDEYCCFEEADLDYSDIIDIGDLTLLIQALFITLQPLQECPEN